MPSSITVESLGISTSELIERVVERIADSALEETIFDEDGRNAGTVETSFHKELDKRVQAEIDKRVDKIAAETLVPAIYLEIDKLVLQRTTEWGEKKGEPMTFVEYLIDRAREYMVEEVDREGRNRKQASSHHSSWRSVGPRLPMLIDRHLQATIEMGAKAALKQANETIAEGLEAAVKRALDDVLKKMQK